MLNLCLNYPVCGGWIDAEQSTRVRAVPQAGIAVPKAGTDTPPRPEYTHRFPQLTHLKAGTPPSPPAKRPE
ncbi:hypothetical protein V496_07044 [Pseudogymnoascus sp. VKM F-4515 (FW-2607)]|nr:hypothetical protein V496_07044 [Pseudogymnoascus sp. VKM F-4515 (FW-2607)]